MLDGVLQQAWKERRQVVVPKAIREAVLGVCYGGTGSSHLGALRLSVGCGRGTTGVRVMLKISVRAVMK